MSMHNETNTNKIIRIIDFIYKLIQSWGVAIRKYDH